MSLSSMPNETAYATWNEAHTFTPTILHTDTRQRRQQKGLENSIMSMLLLGMKICSGYNYIFTGCRGKKWKTNYLFVLLWRACYNKVKQIYLFLNNWKEKKRFQQWPIHFTSGSPMWRVDRHFHARFCTGILGFRTAIVTEIRGIAMDVHQII